MAPAAEQLTLSFEDLYIEEISKSSHAVPIDLLPLNDYDVVILHLSGGADSMATLFELKKRGLDFSKLELWHQAVDGKGDDYKEFWDWPVTEAYCEAVGTYFNVPVYYQWKRGGLYAELMRENSLTGDVLYEENGSTVCLPTTKGNKSTRLKFPAQSANLRIRWCSTFKVDSANRSLNNNPRLVGTKQRPKKILNITGERWAEGGNRSNYLEAERHRSTTYSRRVDHWRPVISYSKSEVFNLFREYKIMPHPAYYLGFGRVSCMGCIFSTAHQWAALLQIARERVEQFAQTEQLIGHTIDVNMSVLEKAVKGAVEKVLPLDDPMLPRWIELALSKTFSTHDLIMENWVRPIGASRGCDGGPS